MPGKYVVYFILAVLVCMGCAKLWPANNPLEEHIEDRLERGLEEAMNMPEGSMKGVIDLSSEPEENGKKD